MKLHELPRNTRIYLQSTQKCDDGSTYVDFITLDGMYSYCKTKKGNTIHLWAKTELELKDDKYYLI